MPQILKPDLCVIGAGSAGLSVAAAAAAFNVDVVLLEKDKMGGDCLNTGCVPSKAIIAVARAAKDIDKAKQFGIEADIKNIDFKAVMAHVHDVIKTIEPHDSVERFEGLGVHVIQDHGQFIDERTVAAGDYHIKARRFIIATGSRAMVPPVQGLDDVEYLTNENIFDLQELPQHLLVIGGGPIGMELAQSFARLGSKVSVVEMFAPLAKDDPELTSITLETIEEDGVEIHAHSKTLAVRGRGADIEMDILAQDNTTHTLEGSHLLVAAGRAPNVNGLGLDKAGISYSQRGIEVRQGLKTSNKRVYAIGDVIGGLQFTHAANYHAGLVIRNALFRMPVKENRELIPWATYTDPEIAQVGLNEEQAQEKHGSTIRVMRFPMASNDRALADGKKEGLIKVITTSKGVILGAGIVGEKAGELVNIWSYAMANKMKINTFMNYISPYPTRSEIHKMTAIDFMRPKLANPWLGRFLKLLRLFG